MRIGRWLMKHCSKTTLLVVVAVLLLHPFRFSETSWAIWGIKSKDILKELQTNAILPSDPYQKLCSIDIDALKNWTPENGETEVATIKGGKWRPSHCQPRFDTAIIVPYRDRETHLKEFLQWMHPFLQAQNISYSIYVIEQMHGRPFNRAKLFNVGFMEARRTKKNKQCFVFHDVDLLPLNAQNIYACSRFPTHLSAFVDTFRFNLPYRALFGGAVAISQDTFEAVNGFSNVFFGWGGEDDDFWANRLNSHTKNVMQRYDRTIAKYQMLDHVTMEPAKDRHEKLEKGRFTVTEDGLSNVNYTVISHVERDLYTHLLVLI